jgi:glutathione S-transferase
MITLHCFGPAPELPDFSPFVVKVMALMKFAGLDFIEKRRLSVGAPKGKLPFIEDDGETIADSTFIRFHLEQKHGVDLDKNLSPEQKAQAWAIEKMCEEHLYFALLHSRWMVDSNFELGGSKLFDTLPPPIQPFIKWMVRRQFERDLWGQGMGRHSAE